MGLPALEPASQCHFCPLEDRVAPGVSPLGARAPRAARSPLMSKDFLAAQITRASKPPQEPPGSRVVTPTVLWMHRVGSQKGVPRARAHSLGALPSH